MKNRFYYKNIKFKLLIILLSAFTLQIVACGGGSVGTGSGDNRMIEGKLSDESGNPIASALVTIEETGEQATTDSAGNFSISTTSDKTQLSLRVESDGFDDKIIVNDENKTDRTLVQIRVDRKKKTIEKIKSLSVSAKIVGKCDSAFENRSTIRQSNKLANGTECTLKVVIFGDGKPLGDIPFVLQHRECDTSKSWRDSVIGATREVTTPGIEQVNFIFKTDSAHCQYRVVAPYRFPGLEEVVFPIETFQSQKK